MTDAEKVDEPTVIWTWCRKCFFWGPLDVVLAHWLGWPGSTPH